MEALALLCTLHADGPSSLRRLRRAGCGTVQQLESLPPDDLARILEVPPAVARRLGREARGLVSRLDLGPFEDREESPELGFSAGFQRAPAGTGLGRRDRALLEEVLDRWRGTDTPRAPEVPPLVLDPPVEEVQDESGGIEPVDELDLARTVEHRAPAPPAAPRTLGLSGGELDGLDAALAADLNRAGVGDLAALIECDALDLAQRICRPFTQLRRLQFLARRERPAPVGPAPGSDPPPRAALVPATELELPVPRVAPARPRPEASQPAHADVPAPALGPRKFWEPRPQWAGDLGQTVPVEEPILLPPEPPTPPAQPRFPRRQGRTLNWTFELPTAPRPAAPDLDSTLGPLDCPSVPPAPMEPPREDEGAAGPFA